MTTVSNTKIISSTAIAGSRVRDIFNWTPRMATYLLAFIVSKYGNNTNAANNFGVFARPEAIPQTNRSLTFGQEMLNKLGTYLGIDYYAPENNITKMDMAAIPDFSAGG
jgi:aminopeptidase N